MASNGIINGSKYLILIGGRYAMMVTGSSINVAEQLRDISVRETRNWNTSINGMREWSVEYEGLLGWRYSDGTINSVHSPAIAQETYKTLKDGYFRQEKLYIALVSLELGDVYWEGFTYLNGISMDTPNEDNSTISLSFTGINSLRQSIAS